MANNKVTAFNPDARNAATPPGTGRRRKTTPRAATDRSPATGTTVATSEEVLAVADDRSSERPAASSSTGNGPTYDEIAQAAYDRYLQRGGTHGQDMDDWITAERELNERRSR